MEGSCSLYPLGGAVAGNGMDALSRLRAFVFFLWSNSAASKSSYAALLGLASLLQRSLEGHLVVNFVSAKVLVALIEQQLTGDRGASRLLCPGKHRNMPYHQNSNDGLGPPVDACAENSQLNTPHYALS